MKNKKKIFKKYIIFIYYLILNLNFELKINLENYENEKKFCSEIFYYIELLFMLYNHLQKNSDKIIDEEFITFFLNSRRDKDKTDLNFFKVPQKRFNQLYRQYMKRLFLFNGLWSKKDIFFPKRNNNKFLMKSIMKLNINK